MLAVLFRPFCRQVVELDELADGSKVQEALAAVTGRRTVPQVGPGAAARRCSRSAAAALLLQARWGGSTLPAAQPSLLGCLQVFVGGNHVGGCDDTVAAYNSGKLKSLLEAAGVKAKL